LDGVKRNRERENRRAQRKEKKDASKPEGEVRMVIVSLERREQSAPRVFMNQGGVGERRKRGGNFLVAIATRKASFKKEEEGK